MRVGICTAAIVLALLTSPAARYGWIGEHAVWAQSAKDPAGILVPLWAGPVIVDRKARRA